MFDDLGDTILILFYAVFVIGCVVAIITIYSFYIAISWLTDAMTEHGIPYKSHPFYKRRVYLLALGGIGMILSLITFTAPSYSTGGIICVFHLAAALISTIFAACDVFFYALAKLKKPDEDPKWPTRKIILIEFILTFIWLWIFWGEFVFAVDAYRLSLWQAWANLAALAMLVLHAMMFYDEFMLRKKAEWFCKIGFLPGPGHQCIDCARVTNSVGGIASSSLQPDPCQSRATQKPVPSTTPAQDPISTLPVRTGWQSAFATRPEYADISRDDNENGEFSATESTRLFTPVTEESSKTAADNYGSVEETVQHLNDQVEYNRSQKEQRERQGE